MPIAKTIYASMIALLLSSCGLNESADNATTSIENDEEVLASRMTAVRTELSLSDIPVNLFLQKQPDHELGLTLVGEILAPEVNGTTVQATDVFYASNLAYVSYNVIGATQAGAAEIIDVKKASTPTLLSQISFFDADVNAISYASSYAYLAGAKTDENPAYVKKIGVKKKKFTDDIIEATLASYAANDVVISGSTVYVTSGNTGGLSILDKQDLSITKSEAIATARAVDYHGNKMMVLAGEPGTLHPFDKAGTSTGSAIALGGATIAESKSTIDMDSRVAVLALGDGGTKILCLSSNTELATIPQITKAGLESSKTVTNSAYMYAGLLFTASGEAGVYVYQVSKGGTDGDDHCASRTATLLGSIDFGAALSANHVYYRKGILFVADGLGGLKIVEVEWDDFDEDDEDDEDEEDEDDEDEEDEDDEDDDDDD